ncbi:hypothetical protein BDV3_006415 [Batrachochytrium dendrobatidis]|uniref:CBM1 domain-containing protein n=1 Tax=Batrachochytrium dendrobatidis (strain JEL423) TaxID=403673 RepID=A0A177WNT0_BATDL|nr:hypothetical protein O5D80_002871 [Batrachochytrium dendrobatidis]KAK5668851.1 hypothetical protein QVD99_004633 [Batrachochytrium dendrobatidis]OAJ41768.1 hypothetical protein BDEG_25312 [Batrachochytrium dendrobatidis JEL423]
MQFSFTKSISFVVFASALTVGAVAFPQTPGGAGCQLGHQKCVTDASGKASSFNMCTQDAPGSTAWVNIACGEGTFCQVYPTLATAIMCV